jgi:hypothetical protein
LFERIFMYYFAPDNSVTESEAFAVFEQTSLVMDASLAELFQTVLLRALLTNGMEGVTADMKKHMIALCQV